MKDILVFMSDQHSPLYSSHHGGLAETPALEQLCNDGISFSQCYTSCPLCVPARMSMLSGKLPSETGVMLNQDTLSNMTPTFLHPFVAAGYETVLIGRMHFIGIDQRHGFTKRLGQDMTPVTWNRPMEQLKLERGVFDGTFDAVGCTRVVGAGNSPVLAYDQDIIEEAVAYLSHDHSKPQLIIVGTYSPHFPYVAPVELYHKYIDKVTLPPLYGETPDYMILPLKKRQRVVDERTVLMAQAAYLGMITFTDTMVGRVREAFEAYCKRRRSDYLFCYLSDHGDQVGNRNIFGKSTFFEESAKIPLMIAGTGIASGHASHHLCSIMDLGPTLCSWAEVECLSDIQGQNLLKPSNKNAMVFSEAIEMLDGRACCGVMARHENWKYVVYSGYEDQDMLFDVANDPQERNNLAGSQSRVLNMFRDTIRKKYDFQVIEAVQRSRARMVRWLQAWESANGADECERWLNNPDSAKGYPEISNRAFS